MTADRPGTSRAWLIWASAVLVYLAAVFHRGSLGVAGPEALERFGVGPAALSAFTVLQMGIYAAMQVPTGLLVDRFGSRRVVTAAAVLLGLGQLLFAVASSYPAGLLARAVLGMGDALVWVSVLRLVAAYFSARQYAIVTTLSSALGAVGGVAATFPLGSVLKAWGWGPTFLLCGAVTLVYAVLPALVVRDKAVAVPPNRPQTSPGLLRRVREVWAVPGTRLAFWVHFCTLFVAGVLSLLWGYPYLVGGLGVEEEIAGLVLSVLIIGQAVGGPLVGALIGPRPVLRMPLVAGFLMCNAVSWVVLLAWPGGTPPLAVVVAAFAVFSLGGPMSAVAFALVRDYNPLGQVGTATGVANVGGHSATAVGALAVGVLLDVTGNTYRIAMLALVIMLVLSSWRTFVWWRRARAQVLAAQQRGDPVPVLVRRRSWDLPEDASQRCEVGR